MNTSVASFIKCLDEILQPHNLDFLTIYVDDILIASRTIEEHVEHLEYVLEKLYQGGLTVNWDKSKFLQTEILFLGFIITQMCIRDRSTYFHWDAKYYKEQLWDRHCRQS